MSNFTPTIGAAGLYNLLAPYNTLVAEGVSYRCDGIRTVQDITATGGDAYRDYYEPYGLSREVFDADVAAGAYIVSLQADAGNWVFVPNTYIIGMPDINGVSYLGTILALDLSLLPADIDLSYVKEKLADVVREVIGVETTAKTITTTAPLIKTQDQHTIIEASRALIRTESLSDYALYLQKVAEVASLQQKVTELEAWIVANRPTP